MHGRGSRLLVVAGTLLAGVPGVASAYPAGSYFLVGAGANQFTKSAMSDAFDTGVSWRAALGAGNGRYVGAEAAYVGEFHNGKSNGPDLLFNGAEGIIRLQYPAMTSSMLLEPFVFGGVGFSHVTVRNAPAGGNDNIGTVPFGAGVTLGLSKLLIDARFTFRPTFSDDLSAGTGGNASMQHWDVGASIGWEF